MSRWDVYVGGVDFLYFYFVKLSLRSQYTFQFTHIRHINSYICGRYDVNGFMNLE